MTVVTGSVTARQDSFDEVRKLSLEHVHRSRGEPGCIAEYAGCLRFNNLTLQSCEEGRFANPEPPPKKTPSGPSNWL